MDPDLWKKVDALLDQALAQPPYKREAFVVEASKDNAELRDEVLSLLKAQSQAANFMERSAMRVAGGIAGPGFKSHDVFFTHRQAAHELRDRETPWRGWHG